MTNRLVTIEFTVSVVRFVTISLVPQKPSFFGWFNLKARAFVQEISGAQFAFFQKQIEADHVFLPYLFFTKLAALS